MKVLVIEDEPRMLELLRRGLSEHGHAVMAGRDGAEGLGLTLNHSFDVIVLDVGLPGLSGYDVAQVLRERQNPAAILMLTALDKEDDVVRGLNLGADDYLTKPFSFPELLARIRSVTRAASGPLPTSLAAENLLIDLLQHRVSRDGRPIELTRTEFVLLEILMQNAPGAVPRSVLVERIWGKRHDIGAGALDVLINAVRSKVDGPFPNKLIRTVRGMGYSLAADTRPFAAAQRSHAS